MINENYLLYLYGISAMVSSESDSDTGLPDPDNSSTDLTIPNVEVILLGDDDEDLDDQDTTPFDQYQPLPLEDSADSNYESTDDELQINENSSNPVNTDVPSIVPIEDTLLKEVWCDAPPKSSDIEMDSQKVDEVKQVMVNITLPSSSIPEWAIKIPEEEWKQELMERIERIKREG